MKKIIIFLGLVFFSVISCKKNQTAPQVPVPIQTIQSSLPELQEPANYNYVNIRAKSDHELFIFVSGDTSMVAAVTTTYTDSGFIYSDYSVNIGQTTICNDMGDLSRLDSVNLYMVITDFKRGVGPKIAFSYISDTLEKFKLSTYQKTY